MLSSVSINDGLFEEEFDYSLGLFEELTEYFIPDMPLDDDDIAFLSTASLQGDLWDD